MSSLKRFFIEIIVFILLCVAVFIIVNKYLSIQKELQNQKNINIQNKTHYDELYKQKDDSLQTLAGLVKSLNESTLKAEEKYIFQKTSLQLKIKQLEAAGVGTSIVTDDSLQVSFKDSVSIIAYSGYTTHYFKLNTNTYHITFTFNPIEVSSEFYKDSLNIWRLKTISKTPGISLRSDYLIDSTFYSIINTNSPVKESNKDDHVLGLRAYVGVNASLIKDQWYNSHTVEASLEGYYKYLYVRYSFLSQAIGLGLFYDLNLTKPYEFIKNIF